MLSQDLVLLEGEVSLSYFFCNQGPNWWIINKALGDTTLGDVDTEEAEAMGDMSAFSQGDLDATEGGSPAFNYSEGEESDASDLDINWKIPTNRAPTLVSLALFLSSLVKARGRLFLIDTLLSLFCRHAMVFVSLMRKHSFRNYNKFKKSFTLCP